MANRLSTDYGIFDTNGYVKNDHWGNVVRILETFMSGIKNSFSVMQGFARMDSGDLNIFACTHKKVASRIQLAKWVKQAWEQVSDLTPCRRISQVMTSMKTTPQTSDTLAAIYNDAMSRVSTLLGDDFKLITPVANYDNFTSRAEVDIFPLMASFLTLAQIGDSNKRLWSLIQKQKLKETLFPSVPTHPELGMKSAMEALEVLDRLCSVEGIQVVTRSKHSDPAVHQALEGDYDEYAEEGPECTEEQIEALKRYLPEGYRDVDVAKATKTRASAEISLKSDSAESKCSKRDCKNPPACFIYKKRIWIHPLGCPCISTRHYLCCCFMFSKRIFCI